MTEVNGELSCVSGGMGLSVAARRQLTGIVEAEPAPSDPLRFRVGGEWHCPADGVLMIESDSAVGCPACGRALPWPVLCGLIELNLDGHAR